jgi:hypothetical protein
MKMSSLNMGLSSKVPKDDGSAALGPYDAHPEIVFVPSGNTPDIDLGAPLYDESVASRRRNAFMTMKHSIKEKMELYTSSTKGNMEDLKNVLENDAK